MKGRALSTLLIIAGIAILPSTALAEQRSLKDQLLGTWTLTAWEQVRAEGSKVQRFGAEPRGITIFDETDRVFVMFSRSDIPKLAGGNPMNPTPEEARAVAVGSIAYYGTYTTDDTAKTVTIRIENSTFRNQVGAVQQRAITSLTADELKFTNLNPTSGGQIFITMKRAQPRATN